MINKYYPPDFDPLKVERRRKPKTKSTTLQTVRLMTPFSMRCNSCSEYISKSKKFNAKKEDTNERYLQQKIFRFHIRCPRCNGEIVFRTDPKTSDFVMEHGGERNYNPVKDKSEVRLESYDEILERLEQEDAKEKEELLQKEKLNKMNKVQELEGKLLMQEQELKQNEELVKIMQRQQDQQIFLKVPSEVDDEFEKYALKEFAKLKNSVSASPVVNSSLSAIAEKKHLDTASLDKSSLQDPKSLKHPLVSGYSSDSDDEPVKKIKVTFRKRLSQKT